MISRALNLLRMLVNDEYLFVYGFKKRLMAIYEINRLFIAALLFFRKRPLKMPVLDPKQANLFS